MLDNEILSCYNIELLSARYWLIFLENLRAFSGLTPQPEKAGDFGRNP